MSINRFAVAVIVVALVGIACGGVNSAPVTTPQAESQIQSWMDDKATPPSDGMYLVVNGKPVALQVIPFRTSNVPNPLDAISVSTPATTNAKPYILLQSQSTAPAAFGLVHVVVGIGFTCGNIGSAVGVAYVSQGSGAEEAGLQPDDIIVSIDGQDLNGSCQTASALSRGILGETSNFKILRGTQTIDLKIIRKFPVDMKQLTYSIVPKGKFVQLIPDQLLDRGIYCFFSFGSSYDKGSCFIIK